jgi:hypothetical protein
MSGIKPRSRRDSHGKQFAERVDAEGKICVTSSKKLSGIPSRRKVYRKKLNFFEVISLAIRLESLNAVYKKADFGVR